MGSFPGFILFTESVLRNQSPSFATETLSIFSPSECASLIAVTRSGGEVRVHHDDEPDEATHPGEDSDKKEKYTMIMVRRVQRESRMRLVRGSIGSFAATLPMGLCS